MTISKKRLNQITQIKDSDINYSDIPQLDETFWKKAKLIKPVNKEAVSIRLDSDVLNWFKGKGKGYQSIINSVLKTYVEALKSQRALS